MTDGDLPSRFKPGATVVFNAYHRAWIGGCTVEAVRFTESKVRYDLAIPVEGVITRLRDVDSEWVVTRPGERSLTIRPEQLFAAFAANGH